MRPTPLPAADFATPPWPNPQGREVLEAVRQPLLPPILALLRKYPELIGSQGEQAFIAWSERTTNVPAAAKILSTVELLRQVHRVGLRQAFLGVALAVDPPRKAAYMRVLQPLDNAEIRQLFGQHRFLMGETAQMVYGLLAEEMYEQGNTPAGLALERLRGIARTVVESGDIELAFAILEAMEAGYKQTELAPYLEALVAGTDDPSTWDPALPEVIETVLARTTDDALHYWRGMALRRRLEAILAGLYGPPRAQRQLFLMTLHEAARCHPAEEFPDHWAHLQIYAAQLLRPGTGEGEVPGMPLQELLERLMAALELANSNPYPDTFLRVSIELCRTLVVRASWQWPEAHLPDLKMARSLNDEALRIYREVWGNRSSAVRDMLILDQGFLRTLTLGELPQHAAKWQTQIDSGGLNYVPRGAWWN